MPCRRRPHSQLMKVGGGAGLLLCTGLVLAQPATAVPPASPASSASSAKLAAVSAPPASAASAALPGPAAQPPAHKLPRQQLQGHKDEGPFGAALNAAQLQRARSASSDSARLLQDLPGVSLYGAGGVSSLPALNGLADDRLRTQVDGMDLVAACPNHMNPALSYIDPDRVGVVRVFAGISPVSIGGDSIGGSIQVEAKAPEFAEPGQGLRSEGRWTGFMRSNGQARGQALSALLATDTLHLDLSASTAWQRNLHAARAFKPAVPGSETGPVIPGDEIASSAYQTRNESLRLAWRAEQHLLQFSAGHQRMGFEGFPNQRMDMTDDLGQQWSLRYTGQFDGLRLQAKLWRQDVHHAMDMGPDRFFYGYGMPMLTEATTQGTQADAQIDLPGNDLLRLGMEHQSYVLYDWWPPVGGSMGPNAFWNIDDGRRLRDGAFAEWEAHWGTHWSTLAGLRADQVRTDVAKVQGYDNGLGAIWGQEAAAFNAGPRSRQDHWVDLMGSLRYQPDAGTRYEIGLARQTHAPNLYQRYAWSTQPMAALMNNFVGDGNGYIGNPYLRPERAHTLAASAEWRSTDDSEGLLKAQAHLTQVSDFMDARRCDFGQCSTANVDMPKAFVLLQYVNVPARLQGLDLSGERRLWHHATRGRLKGSFVLSTLSGQRRDNGDGLYNLMPPQLRLSLEHQRGALSTVLEVQGVSAKTHVSQVRNEMSTAGYGLVHLRSRCEWAHARLEFAIENLFDRFYTPPLGGAYLGQGRSMTSAGIPWGVPVPGTGRSFNTSLTLWF